MLSKHCCEEGMDIPSLGFGTYRLKKQMVSIAVDILPFSHHTGGQATESSDIEWLLHGRYGHDIRQ